MGLGVAAYIKFVHDFLSNGDTPPAAWIEKVLQMYPPTAGDNRPTASNLIADATFVCSARYVADAFAKNNQASFLYHFALKALDGLTVGCSLWSFFFFFFFFVLSSLLMNVASIPRTSPTLLHW